MSTRLRFLISVVALFSGASVWAADDGPGPVKGQFYIHPFMAFYTAPSKLGFDDSANGPGIAFGYEFLPHWAMEASYDQFEPDLDSPPGGNGDIYQWAANVQYQFNGTNWFTPFVTVGGGRGSYDRKPIAKDSDQNEYNAGVGAYFGTSKRFAFRADVRALYTNDAEKTEPWASVGAVFKFGRVEEPAKPTPPPPPPPPPPAKCSDADNDGVCDASDRCPGTPSGTKVDSNGCPPPAPAATFDLTVEFAFNSAEINDLSFRELRKAMTFLRENPTTKAVIEGNTDSRGTDAYNQKLSERRAAAVKDVLVKSGIEGDRLSTVGYGESKPVAPNDTDEGRQKNRRVSIVVK